MCVCVCVSVCVQCPFRDSITHQTRESIEFYANNSEVSIGMTYVRLIAHVQFNSEIGYVILLPG